ncbi:MAG: histidine kinase [Pseudomonadota bacterium]|nr:histidine kinase [Pseudomonadota bacterium]
MISQAFKHRSGRVISLSRLVLASVFLFALWVDPTVSGPVYAVLGVYVAASGAYLALTWSNWRLEFRLALPAHVVDISVFGLLVALTEGYTSPFFSFFVFIVLAAMIRWGWRATAVTALVLIVLFFAGGFVALEYGQGGFELTRLIVRGSYLVVLSLVIIWFSVSLADARPGGPIGIDPVLAGSPRAAIPALLDHAARQLQAGRVLFAWSEDEEPWLNVARLGPDGCEEERFAPDVFPQLIDPSLEKRPFLFDAASGAALALGEGDSRVESASGGIDRGFAARFGLSQGLAVPISGDGCAGVLFATDIAGMCADDLLATRGLADGMSAALTGALAVQLREESSAGRTRLSLARDLHDSVVQLLAGLYLRLEAVRKAYADAAAADELESLQREITAEQRGLRRLIEQLRSGGEHEGPADLCRSLAVVAERSSRQWGIRCAIGECPDQLQADPRFEHELRHMVREAISNAVRHGAARNVSIDLLREGPRLVVRISADGAAATPCAGDGTAAEPRSLKERVATLGGELRLAAGTDGSRLIVTLPFEAAR